MSNLLLYLIACLLPTQLGKHFWFPFSYVYGLPIDYLSIVVYFLDVLVVFYLLLNSRLIYKLLIKIFSSSLTWLIFSFICINIVFSVSPIVSILSFVRWATLLIFSLVVYQNKIHIRQLIPYLTISGLFIIVLAVLQLLNQGSLGGIFYWFGERTFTLTTPGIAKITYCLSENCFSSIRPYATFSHPNSFSGYLLIVAVLIYTNTQKKVIRWFSVLMFLFVSIISIKLFLSVTFFLILGLVALLKNKTKTYLLLLLLLNVSIIPMSYVVTKFYPSLSVNNQSIWERISLNTFAVSQFYKKMLTGVGQNAFISSMEGMFNPMSISTHRMLLQPVHHVLLLTLTQLGVLLSLPLFYSLYRFTKSIKLNLGLYLALIIVLVTSSLDHYWITLPQNQYLLMVIFAIRYNSVSVKHI